MIEVSTVYFESPGKENTDETLRLAKRRADQLGIRDIVLASYTGYTALKAVEVFKGYNLVIVTHFTGFKEPGVQELSDERAKKIRASGGKILTATHVFIGVDRAIQRKFDTVYPAGIIAQTLRLYANPL